MTDKVPAQRPANRPAHRRVDEAAADTVTLVDMGVVEPPPEPEPEVPKGPSPEEQANEASLQAALSDAGVTMSGRDEQVIDVLAKLDPSDVEALTRWLADAKPADEPPPQDPRK